MPRVDVHQHLWTEPLIAELERRGMWADDVLSLPGEPDSTVVPDDLAARAQLVLADGLDLAIVAPSFALGPDLLPAYHEGAKALPPQFRAYCSTLDPDELQQRIEEGFVGVAIAAPDLTPSMPILQQTAVPVFVHPGVAEGSDQPAIFEYVTQMHEAWWRWAMAPGEATVIWAMCAGLAPLHHERARARGIAFGGSAYYDSSSYGPQALAAMREAGCELVYGSDRPVVEPGAAYFSSADVFLSS